MIWNEDTELLQHGSQFLPIYRKFEITFTSRNHGHGHGLQPDYILTLSLTLVVSGFRKSKHGWDCPGHEKL